MNFKKRLSRWLQRDGNSYTTYRQTYEQRLVGEYTEPMRRANAMCAGTVIYRLANGHEVVAETLSMML